MSTGVTSCALLSAPLANAGALSTDGDTIGVRATGLGSDWVAIDQICFRRGRDIEAQTGGAFQRINGNDVEY